MGGLLSKANIGKEDLEVQTNTNDTETFERLSSTGGTQTLKKIPDLWDGTGKINIKKVLVNGVELSPLANHHGQHQYGGSDEISVAGLSGTLCDKQDANKLQGRTLVSTAPTSTQVLAWNSGTSQWEPTNPAAPGAHHTSHEKDGSDAIKLDDLSTPDDNTDLNASTSKHGLCPKFDGDSTHFLSGAGTQIVPAYASIRDKSRNLIVKTNASNPTYQVDIDADEVMLQTAAGVPYSATSVNLTADITSSGTEGLDTGAEANSTWYYVWVIYNGTTVASLLSASSTAPTMPGDYTYKALVGYVRNNASSNFLAFNQVSDAYYYNAPIKVVNDGAVKDATSLSLSAVVPSKIKGVFGKVRVDVASGHFHFSPIDFGAGHIFPENDLCLSTYVTLECATIWNLPLLVTDQTMYWALFNYDLSITMDIWISGFTLR